MNIITMKRVLARSLTDTSTIRSSSLSFLHSLSSTSTTVADVDIDAPPSTLATKLVTPSFLQPRVVLYDGVCHLCHRGVKLVIRADKDRKIKFCCVQSKAAEPYLRASGLEREDVLRRFLFIEGLNVFSQGSTAALRVLSYLPLPYSALSWLWVIPIPIRDAVYDYIAKNQYEWFGKAEDCLVLQEKELLERFIDRDEMMNRDS
ncbi:putative thiol-disulfide oxidoreductase DCC [Trifolium repens]|nr:putative thiol-disulfide oxidoreductase DCC [Trifolium repens]